MEANASSGTELSKLISAVVYLIGYQFGTAGEMKNKELVIQLTSKMVHLCF